LSETLGPRSAFRQLLEQRIPGFVLFDLGWCGGLTEARAIAAMAEAYQLPVAPHDCTGPVIFTASVHFSLSVPNSFIQEFVRAFYFGWYREIVTALPSFADGVVRAAEGAGLGIDLRPELWERSDAHIRISRWSGI
jgi:galactonate dehydratase